MLCCAITRNDEGVAGCCSVLQRVAACCRVLQRVSVLQYPKTCMLCCAISRNAEGVVGCCRVLLGVALCNRALQGFTVCCSIQGHACSFALCPGMTSVLQCVAMYCSV